MQIKISKEAAEAAERVRKRGGDRSITAAVERLIAADDAAHVAPSKSSATMTRAEAADAARERMTKRKGAK